MALLLVRPASFGYNAETALTNTFQKQAGTALAAEAQREFDAFADRLRQAGISLTVIEDTADLPRPDAVFPNNWISFHDGSSIAIWPMQAVSRRTEKRRDIVDHFLAKGYREVVDFSHYESEGRFLEGTGSLVIDYRHRIAYAALSARSDGNLLRIACRRLNYQPVSFRTIPVQGISVYHTNVLMALHPRLAVLCEAIIDPRDREMVRRMLLETGHELLTITPEQMHAFAGNMLFTQNEAGDYFCILSAGAAASLTPEQTAQISRHATLLSSDLHCIETAGGGSARCMLAEIR